MRRFVGVTVILGFIAASPSLLCAADPWEAYMRLMSNYYFLDNQAVNRVSCHVVLPTLDPVKLRDQLKPLGDKVTLKENLKDFKVIYSKKDGVTFLTPDISAVLVSTDGVEDQKKVEEGVKMINHGAKMQIEGATQAIKSILDDLILPKKDSMTDLVVSSAEGKTTVNYRREGNSCAEVYSDDTKKITSKSPASEIEATEEFTKINGKLALAKGTAQIHQGELQLGAAIIVQYQDLGKSFFPSVLEQHLQMTGPGMKQEAQFSVSFDGCEIE